ncbi:ornithine cyclodeaminase family protein [Thioclava atlantica]|uniref:Ornithine cyclodeaminase n=1 Tax=Thioclava atlantica TaxID=1317124 RepID=A0A085TUT8_9RHOB|nr:ornithine cyclodeaminase [Thioclava atlantica]KFE34485.1 ornithine cyclodeaminase [Thioclava atlantica]
MTTPILTYDAMIDRLDWHGAVAALRAGHRLARAEIGDTFLGPAEGTLLSRSAYIDGLGYGVKSFTVFGANPKAGLPTVQGAMLVFEPEHGALQAIVESPLVTDIKTAADSGLGAQLLARPDSKRLLIVGGGTVARSLVSSYGALFPGLEEIAVWTRRPDQARALVEQIASPIPLVAVEDLAEAAGRADIVSCATMAREPVLRGDWIRPGTHVDLIGAFKTDMREADDALIAGGRLFVDSRETTLGHIGELTIPLAAGVISEADVLGDLYDLIGRAAEGRSADDEITIFKNGGGAHLDLMIANYIAARA